jgi:DNA-binding NtrC family response regulator
LIQQVRQDIELAASVDDMNVLIIGEPGIGKELVAQCIHKASRRAKKHFVSINCSAINHTLIENEFFEFVKGALITTSARKPGLLKSADCGTLFLDEIDDLTPEIQARLVALLRERDYEKAGLRHTLKLDIRLIAAANHDLRRDADEGRFRRGLYDRPVRIPYLDSDSQTAPHGHTGSRPTLFPLY